MGRSRKWIAVGAMTMVAVLGTFIMRPALATESAQKAEVAAEAAEKDKAAEKKQAAERKKAAEKKRDAAAAKRAAQAKKDAAAKRDAAAEEADEAENEAVNFRLAFASADVQKCLPDARVRVEVKLEAEEKGRDVMMLNASGLKPDTDFAAFLTEDAADPFGAVEQIGNFETDKRGKAHAEFRLIVEDAFASTLVEDVRVRAELDNVGIFFSDPADDDVCFGEEDADNDATPFDGDGVAGVQAFNTANISEAPLS